MAGGAAAGTACLMATAAAGTEGGARLSAAAVGSPHTEGTHTHFPSFSLSPLSSSLFLSPSLSPRRHPAVRRHLSPRPRPLAASPSFYSPLGTPSTPGRHRHPQELPRAPGTRRQDSHTGSCTGVPRLCPYGTEWRGCASKKVPGRTPRSRLARPSGPQRGRYTHTPVRPPNIPTTRVIHTEGPPSIPPRRPQGRRSTPRGKHNLSSSCDSYRL